MRKMISTVGMLVCAASALAATEYFVDLDGCDASHDGRTPATAFRTVQRGVDALQPGDTLTIMPGEYFEGVQRDQLGADDAVTTIRAAIPGTAVLRGDMPAPEFRLLEGDGGHPVYGADFDPEMEVLTVNELDTLFVLQGRPQLAELRFMPGVFFQDRARGRLYITTTDSRPPQEHRYSLSVIPGSGLHLASPRREVGPRRVIVEGLAVTGFNTARFDNTGYGIKLDNALNCVVRDCFAWLNGWGIRTSAEAEDSGGNIIERCVAWANDSPFANSRIGGLIALNHRADIIRDSTAFLNAHCGIYLRGDADEEKTSRLLRNLAWGNRWDLLIKGNPGGINAMEHCIGRSYSTRENASWGLYHTRKRADLAEDAPGTIVLDEEVGLDVHREFADPDNRDYRLQSNSRFRGSGPDGGDRGPFAYRPNIFFVAPDGDDAADGLSVENAWQTPRRALQDLKPGATLYLAAGVYRDDLDWRLHGTREKPIHIRGRGHAPAVFTGAIRVSDSRHAVFERISFESGVMLADCAAVTFENCRWSGADPALAAGSVDGLKLAHCVFAGFRDAAVVLQGAGRVHLSGNLFDNRAGPAVRIDTADAVRYSDYNAFRRPDIAWEADGVRQAAPDTAGRHERYSIALPAEYAVQPEPYLLHDRPAFTVAGPMGRPFGPVRLAPRREALRLSSEPQVRALGAATVDIEWSVYLPCRVHLAWGATPELENRDVVEVEYFATYSLTGLEPGRTYYFQVMAVEETRRPVGQHQPFRPGNIETTGGPVNSARLSFTTLTEDQAPRTYYVATDGDDTHSGLDRAHALRTIQQAADRVGPGDTVLIAGGEYEEQVRVRATGAQDAPILFRSLPGEMVVMSAGDFEMNDAFVVENKQHVRFDGLYLLSMWFKLYKSDHIEIARMYAGRYSRGYAPGFINASLCRDLTVRNSVALSAKGGPKFYGCENLRIENCVFYRNMISQLVICALPGTRATLSGNIFTDGLSTKSRAAMISLARFDAVEIDNNCFYPRRDWQEKNIVMLYSDEAFERCRVGFDMGEAVHPHPVMDAIVRVKFEGLPEYLGEVNSLLADPQFAGLAAMPRETEDGLPIYTVDRMTGTGPISMDKFFAENPELIERGIGLQPAAFEDFNFRK